MSKVRKAIAAAVSAGIATFVASYSEGITFTEVGTIVAAVVVAGLATYTVRNETDVVNR